MAKPRVFISSTYFDLKSARSDIERTIRDLGYEPVLSERGQVPYAKEQSPEENCYREISSIDLLVSIVGGRFGSNSSQDEFHSVSQQEIRTAQKLNKQIYIFVDRAVLNEHRTYELNKDVTEIRFSSVDDVKIFQFIDELYALKTNNSIFPFETSAEIGFVLKEQLAGLFQRLLGETSARQSAVLVDELRTEIASIREIAGLLSKNIDQENSVVQDVILTTHPIFSALKKLLGVPYRVFFYNLTELTTWLKARNYLVVDKKHWDDPKEMEWISEKEDDKILRLRRSLFDNEGRLRPMNPGDWNDNYLRLTTSMESLDEEEIPF